MQYIFVACNINVYISGSQTGRRGALVRRETLPGAPRKLVKVVAFTAFLTNTAMWKLLAAFYNFTLCGKQQLCGTAC